MFFDMSIKMLVPSIRIRKYKVFHQECSHKKNISWKRNQPKQSHLKAVSPQPARASPNLDIGEKQIIAWTMETPPCGPGS
jgi:hypothetical protein